jgi:hypothetical protein
MQLGLDTDSPTDVAFAASDPANPSVMRVNASDATSGIGGGVVEYRRIGTKAWRAMKTTADARGIAGQMPDGRLRDGRYRLRATVRDLAGNARSTGVRANGSRAVVRLPLRVKAKLTVGRPARRGGQRSRVRLNANPRTRAGEPTQVAGRLTAPGGNPIAGVPVVITARVDVAGAEWRPVGQVTTNRRGRFAYRLPAGPSRIVRFAYAGAPTVRPQLRVVRVRVPAESSIRADRRRVVNGDAVRLTGRIKTGPVPAGGKLVELQFYSRGQWRTFKTTHSDPRGRWKHTYRFTGTVGRQVYRLRVHMPRENGYQYADGGSRSLRVTVRGL